IRQVVEAAGLRRTRRSVAVPRGLEELGRAAEVSRRHRHGACYLDAVFACRTTRDLFDETARREIRDEGPIATAQTLTPVTRRFGRGRIAAPVRRAPPRYGGDGGTHFGVGCKPACPPNDQRDDQRHYTDHEDPPEQAAPSPTEQPVEQVRELIDDPPL